MQMCATTDDFILSCLKNITSMYGWWVRSANIPQLTHVVFTAMCANRMPQWCWVFETSFFAFQTLDCWILNTDIFMTP